MNKEENPTADPLEGKLIRDLAAILEETGLSEIEIEKSGLRVRVARLVHMVAAAPVAPALTARPADQATQVKPTDLSGHPGLVASPMVGTAYMAPSPGAPPFVKVGDTVIEGQPLLVIEAMKTMNQIPSPRAGRVTQVIVSDGQPVEFGEPLLVIE